MEKEIEIKFQLPDDERRVLAAWLRQQSARTKRLQASYFDTADRALARAGISLRLRKEGAVWVQTLKTAPDGSAIARGEHNVRLARRSGQPEPELDLDRHRDTPGWLPLRAALHKAEPLQCLYQTDMRRLGLRSRKDECVIEYALDTGEISAAAGAPPLVVNVGELELELVSGARQTLFAAARRCLQAHELWLDVRSKAVRGDHAARGTRIVPPARAAAIALDGQPSLARLMHAVLCECVRHLMLPASQIASVDGHQPDHVHQARVALRRLRSALRLFDDHLPAQWQAWSDEARELGKKLAGSRDLDVMAASLWPALRQAGAPLVELPPHEEAVAPATAVRDKAVQLWLLDLLTLQAMDPPDDEGPPWKALLPVLDDWHARCRKGARRFDRMDGTQRHQLRKRLKRLRYASEFIAALFPQDGRESFARRLAKALQELGDHHDLLVAIERYREAAQTRPDALFAMGWLTARLQTSEQRCERALKKFSRVAAPWTRGAGTKSGH